MSGAAGSIEDRIQASLGASVERSERLSGGCVADVRLASLADGRRVVVKAGEPGSKLDVEGRMLGYLAEHSSLPVPEVFVGDDDLLVMAYIEHGGGLGREGERHAAEILAALHDIKPTDAGEAQDAYGLGFDTLIGGLPQPNGWDDSWASFFGKRRLIEMAEQAARAGQADAKLVARVESLSGELDGLIGDASPPGLIHGDVWSG
ncbi:MAG: fructosamine kinase, partial [Phycisphaerales bacterium]